MNKPPIYIVGRLLPASTEWEFVSQHLDPQQADAHCLDARYFVAPIDLKAFPRDVREWNGVRFPGKGSIAEGK